MRSLFLSVALGLGALGIVAAAPSTAEARWWLRRVYVDSYYTPGYYYAPTYSSYYYSPEPAYVPSATTYVVPDTYYYRAPSTYYYGPTYYRGYWPDGWRRWR